MTANKREFLFSNNSFPCCYAPINVKPTGGGGGGQGRVAIWHFSKIYSQIPCQRANHSSQMQPISPPRAAHCAVQYPKAGPNCKKGTIKKYLPIKLWNLYLYYVTASPKIQFLLQVQLYVFTIIRVTLRRIHKPLGESPRFVSLNIPFLVKGTKKVIFISLQWW